MGRPIYSCISLILLICCSVSVSAEENAPKLNCDDPLHSVPDAVKQTLGELYHSEAPPAQLVAASAEMQKLASETTFCRIRAQSPSSGTDRDMAWEWITLHQWINRIADFVYLNGQGKNHVDWKLEYADFAKLYEFEA